jgi:hypothetical protein
MLLHLPNTYQSAKRLDEPHLALSFLSPRPKIRASNMNDGAGVTAGNRRSKVDDKGRLLGGGVEADHCGIRPSAANSVAATMSGSPASRASPRWRGRAWRPARVAIVLLQAPGLPDLQPRVVRRHQRPPRGPTAAPEAPEKPRTATKPQVDGRGGLDLRPADYESVPQASATCGVRSKSPPDQRFLFRTFPIRLPSFPGPSRDRRGTDRCYGSPQRGRPFDGRSPRSIRPVVVSS